MKNVYQKIMDVLSNSGQSLTLAPHEFRYQQVFDEEFGRGTVDGLLYVGCSEATLARRLREMRQMGMVTSRTREGKYFLEYSLCEKKSEVAA